MTLAADINLAKVDKPSDGLKRLTALTAEDLRAVNSAIIDKMQSPVALIPQLAGYLIASGGKRLRPMLTLAGAQLCGYQGRRHIELAACIEFIHTATLLHDDVVDESSLRRGASTANTLWGNQSSILVGDFLFSRAFQLMVADGSLKVMKVLSDASAKIAEGEVLQLMTTNDTKTSEEDYLQVVGSKTAVLFAAACRLGAIVAERSEEEEEALEAYGYNFGMAFQLVDDILDFSAEQAALGKTVGDDFREGKMTLPIVLAIARGTAEEGAFWRRCLEDLNQNDGDFAHAVELMDHHGALEASKARARAYAEAAKEALRPFPESPIRSAMIEIADFCIERVY